MAITINKRGTSIIEINDSTKAEPYFLNFYDIALHSAGDLMVISQKGVILDGDDEIVVDYNDVTTPAGTTSGDDLTRTVCELF
jgi:hypothetical protein